MSQELVDGRFRIGQVIGRGNMGEVRRAEDLHAPEGSPERTTAVRTILRSRTGARNDTGGDAKAVQHFSRDVRVTRRLRRESIQHTDGVRAKGVVRHHRPHEEQQ